MLVSGGAGVVFAGVFFAGVFVAGAFVAGVRWTAAVGRTDVRTGGAGAGRFVGRVCRVGVAFRTGAALFADRALEAVLFFFAALAFFDDFVVDFLADVEAFVFVAVLVVRVEGVDIATAEGCAADVAVAVPLALAGCPTRRVAERVRGRTARPHVSAERRRSMWQAAFRGRYDSRSS